MIWISKLRPWQLFLVSVLMSEILVAIMSLLLRGMIDKTSMVSGLIVSSIVASLIIYFVNISRSLRFENDLLLEQQRIQKDIERLFELSGDLICIASMTHFLKINPAGERILGYSQEELLGIPFLDLIHPDDIEPTGKAIESELKKGKSVLGFVNRYRRRDGTYRWLEWMTHPVTQEGMLYAVARDITERKAREEQLYLLKNTVEMISTGITIADMEGRIVYANPSEARMHGYEAGEMVGENVNIFMPEGKRNTAPGKKTAEEIRGWKEYTREIEEVRRDGSVFPVQLKSLPVEVPEKGEVYIITTSEDITERRKAEKSLMLQAQMIDIMKDSLISTDLDGFVKTWNKGAEMLFGYTSFEAIGRHISFVYPPEEHGNLQEIISRLKEKGQYETEVRMQRRSGEPFYAILSLSMIYDDDGAATGMLGYSIDVTERKRMEEDLRHALEDKDVLMREIHHRTKNNMAVIQSLLSLQSRQVQDRDALNSLNESACRVRTMSMIHESLYSTGDLSSINIREYLHSLATELLHGFGADPSTVELNVDVLDINMDVDQVVPIGLIVNELLTNSLKYAFPDGRGGRLLVELKEHDEETFDLTVADSGIGLPGNFDIVSARTLGLQIVSSLSAQIRGRLHASGDKGAAFTVTFKKNLEGF